MKFLWQVAPMAEMSPTCSIMVARAMGAMVRMAEASNLAMTKLGTPKMAAWDRCTCPVMAPMT